MDVEVKRPSELTQAEAQAWAEFQDADPALHSPYFNVEFAMACGRVRTDTCVAVLRDKAVLQGFLPFHRGLFGYCLPLGGPLGDFQGLIARTEQGFDMRAVLGAAGMSVYPFSFVPASQKSFSPCFDTEEYCHTADLSEGFEAWYEGRLSVHKKSLKKHEGNARRLTKNYGELRFTMDDRDPAVFDKLLEWKSTQYRATGFFDVFSVSWTSALLREIWAVQSESFTGQLSTLRAGDHLVAIHFGMRGHHAAHYWFPAYDPTFSNFGVGHTLLVRMLQGHAGARISKVHLGVGDFRYKHQYGGEATPLCSGTAMSPSLGAFCRQSAHLIQRGFEALPLGPVSQFPRRALRRLDREMAFKFS